MKGKLCKRIAILLIGLCTSVVSAQLSISGTVSEANGPLPGANIVVKGTENGAITDFDGNYTLNNVANDAILIVSYVGLIPLQIPVDGRTTIDIVLEPDSSALDEIVIVGYGSEIKRDLTTAVSTIKGDEITQTAVASNPVTALQGLVSGIQVESFGGQPGGKANVFIRGVNSLSNADPLFIVDGLFVNGMEYINPNDIQNISILKDAAAASIYGARAANGVVLIETKHGTPDQKIRVDVNFKTGVDTPSKKLDFINGQQFTSYLNQRFTNDGLTTRVDWNGVDTDWQDQNISSAAVQDYNFSISGGGENSSHFVSANYFKQDGILVGSGFERINFRLNNKFDFGKFHLTQSAGLTQGKLQENQWYGFDGTTAPTVALSNPNNEGGFEAPSTDVQGPGGVNQFALATIEKNLRTTRTLYGSAKFDYDITENLTASVNFGVDYITEKVFQFTPTFVMSGVDAVRNTNTDSDLTEFREETINMLVEPTINYQQEFGAHKLSGVLGYTYFLENQNNAGVYGQGLQPGIEIVSGIPASNQIVLLGEDNTAGLESIFGRVNYNFDSRYLFSGTLRRDASSRFPRDVGRQVGYFPSVSAGWNISNENFWKSETINYLKLRASYGELGSYPNDYYPGLPVLPSNRSNTALGNGIAQINLSDQNVTWETTKTFDIGMDLSLLNSQINFSIDYYAKDIEDVLVAINVPSTAGVSAPVVRNAGSLINQGLEFSLDYKKREGDFTYSIATNFSFNLKSEAGALPNPVLGPAIDEDLRIVNRTISGAPIGAFYGYIVEDKVNPETGDFVRVDVDGNGVIDNDDITIIGDPVPDFTYGLNFNAAYKNFDFVLNFAGVQGNDIYNLSRYYNILWQDGGKLTEVLDSWTPTNTDTTIPRASVSDAAGNKAPSSFFVEDGSYFRLKTLELGYNFDGQQLGSKFIQDLRLSFNVQNVFVLTGYSGYDPDVSSTDGGRASINSGVPGVRDPVNPLLGRGLDARAYPNARTFLLGVSATF